jgi:hypothetical protein
MTTSDRASDVVGMTVGILFRLSSFLIRPRTSRLSILGRLKVRQDKSGAP